MPRVTQKTARKNYPEHGIKKGDTYYTWKFYRSGKRMSKTRPRPSQLTQRADYGALRQAQEIAEDMSWEAEKREDLAGSCGDILTSLEEARDAAQEKYDNLPEQWQSGEQGQNLETFISECEDAITEIEGIRDELADEETDFDSISEPTGISWPNEV